MRTTGGAGNLRHRLLFSVLLCGCGIHHMAHQHRGGHCAHTAGHRGDSLHDGFCLIKAHIAAELALFIDCLLYTSDAADD